jgi:phosphoribosylglycinamide formyltransferase 1
MPISVVVLISGAGSNLLALLQQAAMPDAPFVVTGVISNRADAGGLAHAAEHGVPTQVLDHTGFPDRAAFDAALATLVDGFDPDLVVLAGFMRVLTPDFVGRYTGRMINIHPSLLPAFQGLHTHRRAIAAGVGEHGASVHFVTDELDGGPVIAQIRVAVRPDDDEASLAARVLAREHRLLPQVVCWFAEGRLQLQRSLAWFDGTPLTEPLRCDD